MKPAARNLAAIGSITVIMYSIFITLLGALLSCDAEPVEPVFISPMLVCGLAGFLAAGFGLASCFMSPGRIKTSRLFAVVSAVLSIAVAAVMISSFEYFDLVLTMIFAIPALVLTVAAIVSFIQDKNGQSGTNI